MARNHAPQLRDYSRGLRVLGVRGLGFRVWGLGVSGLGVVTLLSCTEKVCPISIWGWAGLRPSAAYLQVHGA